MERKLVQIGSSLAVTLPSEVVKEFKLKKGHSVEVSVHPVTGVVSIKPGVAFVDEGKMTRRVRAAATALIRRRAKLYRELAK
jgi:antitoxin component of MazEF toxin-antitoxin module